MMVFFVRHGKDDDTVRGGWSNIGLTEYGVEQVHKLGAELKEMELDVDCIYASDLQRAKETAEIDGLIFVGLPWKKGNKLFNGFS